MNGEEEDKESNCSMIDDDDNGNDGSSPDRASRDGSKKSAATAEDRTTAGKIDNIQEDNQPSAASSAAGPKLLVTLIAKYGKERITVEGLDGRTTTIGQVKEYLCQRTRILPKRQKLVGLSVATAKLAPLSSADGTAAAGASNNNNNKGLHDDITLDQLKVKGGGGSTSGGGNNKRSSDDDDDDNNIIISHQFILMGTPEEEIFVDPDDVGIDGNLGAMEVVDDLDWDCSAGSDEWKSKVATDENLRIFTEKTPMHIIHQPRIGKPLLVLDLDHTLLDFSSRAFLQQQQNAGGGRGDAAAAAAAGGNAAAATGGSQQQAPEELAASMKRPYMDDFLTTCYKYYDMVVWSQTSWRWLETKLIELGMLTNTGYKFCFVLDKTSMFTITPMSKQRNQQQHFPPQQHHVKPLQIIWDRFDGRWGPHNTVHVDDLTRNFALNPENGLTVPGFYRKKSRARHDIVLFQLKTYLKRLATTTIPTTTDNSGVPLSFDRVDFTNWQQVVVRNLPLSGDSNNKKQDGSSKGSTTTNGASK